MVVWGRTAGGSGRCRKRAKTDRLAENRRKTRSQTSMGSEPIKPRVPNNSLPVSASPLFTRRCLCLTVGALLRFRAYWAPCGSGRYEVTLDVAHEDQTITRHRLFLASQPNHFGGRRYYLICPACGRRACALYCVRGEFRCRKCTRLRYVSKTWRKDWRLTHHYADLVEALRHRPGPKAALGRSRRQRRSRPGRRRPSAPPPERRWC